MSLSWRLGSSACRRRRVHRAARRQVDDLAATPRARTAPSWRGRFALHRPLDDRKASRRSRQDRSWRVPAEQELPTYVGTGYWPRNCWARSAAGGPRRRRRLNGRARRAWSPVLPTTTSRWARILPSSETSTRWARSLGSSSRTNSDTCPRSGLLVCSAMLEAGSAGSPRRSTVTFRSLTEPTRHCNPSHFTFVNSGAPTPPPVPARTVSGARCTPGGSLRRARTPYLPRNRLPPGRAIRTSGSRTRDGGDVDCGAILSRASPLLELGRRRRKPTFSMPPGAASSRGR